MSSLGAEALAAAALALAAFFGGRLSRRQEATMPASSTPPQIADDRFDSLERLVRMLPAPMLLVERGYLKAMNSAAAEIFKADPDRAKGRALIETVGSIELERVVQRALLGETAEATIALRGIGGDRSLAISAVPLDESAGEVLVFVQDRSKIADSERVRRDFLADISHELRTPISSMRLMVETIQLSGEDQEAIRIFLPKVVIELERMTRMIEDLLALARGESGQVPLARIKVDLGALVSETAATFAHRAVAQDVELAIESTAPVEAEVDADRLRQVVVNLIDNALRHTPAGGHVRVGLAATNGNATLRVQDDGVGIPFKDLPHIFDRFYVVDRSRSRDSGGTGLGLAIVKQIVEAHGGSVHAESELGSGATFYCRLPLKPPINAP